MKIILLVNEAFINIIIEIILENKSNIKIIYFFNNKTF